MKISTVLNIRKSSLLSFLLVAGMNIAHASGIISNVQTSSADAVFSATGKVELQVNPKTGLLAGDYQANDSIGTTTATTDSGIPVIRWTPGSGTITGPGNVLNTITVSGKNNADNKLQVMLRNDSYHFDGVSGGWLVASNLPQGQKDLTFDIVMKEAQHVNPDTFTLSLDAAAWQS